MLSIRVDTKFRDMNFAPKNYFRMSGNSIFVMC
jgi:hypothetical protein